MRYVLSLLVENDNTERLRAFPSAQAARSYVERLAARLSRLCDAGRTRLDELPRTFGASRLPLSGARLP